jgi:hypothetical protein
MEIAQRKKYSTPDCKAFIAKLTEKKAAQIAAKTGSPQDKNGSAKKKSPNGKSPIETTTSAKTTGGT